MCTLATRYNLADDRDNWGTISGIVYPYNKRLLHTMNPHTPPTDAVSSKPLDGKRLVIGVCGGIAAYKACELIRECQRQGATSVQVVTTPSANAFVGPLTFESLTRNAVLHDELGVDSDGTPWHIALAQQADAMIIVPVTANTLAKLAHGQADDMLSTTALCWANKPLIIAPAMNPRMWQHPAVQSNLATLRSWPNVTVVPPTHGLLACGEEGTGHLAPLHHIMHSVTKALQPQKLAGQRFIVTAGGTAEPMDPVRHITNRSSGKMGMAFAHQLWQLGASVHVLATHTVSESLLANTPADNDSFTITRVQTSAQLQQQLHQLAPSHHGIVMAAAVSDFTVDNAAQSKLKRTTEPLTLTLTPNTDVIAGLVATYPHLYALGFAAETASEPNINETMTAQHSSNSDVIDAAWQKMTRKGLHALCLNDVSRNDIGFGTDVNEVTLLLANEPDLPRHLPKADKQLIARQVLWAIADDVLAHSAENESNKNTACKTELQTV